MSDVSKLDSAQQTVSQIVQELVLSTGEINKLTDTVESLRQSSPGTTTTHQQEELLAQATTKAVESKTHLETASIELSTLLDSFYDQDRTPEEQVVADHATSALHSAMAHVYDSSLTNSSHD
ncbi:hypothetical protein BLNAU_21888 [Blattamonas nauphoetae]|uniref:Uncharacterized protein n=1 Tax=Blattamonas nauphoetae TaxID=2049346 RepID=A0ABQ9WUN1_9EUKA|nr:hypothetical protein BLNAU_21888 [Blattamonas nauphoetae]